MLEVEGVTYIYWQIDFPSIVGFVKVFKVERVTYIY
jgi:hypothetical protein